MKEVIIPSIVTIIGFIASYLGIKREFKNSVNMQQNEFVLKKLYDILEMITDNIFYSLDIICRENKDYSDFDLANKLEPLIKKILEYGSCEDIMIIESIRTASYSWEKIIEQKPNYKNYNVYFIANMFLLFCQMKMELTGKVVNPETLLKMTFPKYNEYKNLFKDIINDTVKELALSKKFIIK